MVSRYFPLEEYEARQQRVLDEMKQRGYEVAVVWGRGGGCHERGQDPLYLVNYYSFASGQEPDNELLNARAHYAVILRHGEKPELHMDMPGDRPELLATDRVNWHYDPIRGVAEALKRHKIEGPVALVGSDFLPMKYGRELERLTPQISWQPEDDLVRAVRRVKTPRELDCYREGGEVATKALNCLIEGLIAGKPEAEAAGDAAREIVRGGGSFLMIPCSHGDSMGSWVRNPLYGYSKDAPKNGDLVRGWVLGPIYQGYYLDPGRTAVAGGRPTPDQRAIIEACAGIVDTIIEALRPGKTIMGIARLGEQLSRDAGGGRFQGAEQWPLYGHNLGHFWEDPYIGTKLCKEDDMVEEDMVFGIESFLEDETLGIVGFEQNVIVTAEKTEVITNSPMFWW